MSPVIAQREAGNAPTSVPLPGTRDEPPAWPLTPLESGRKVALDKSSEWLLT